MYLNAKKDVYEVFQELKFKITRCKLLIILVISGRRQCLFFVTVAGEGKETEKHLSNGNTMCILKGKN